MKTFIQVHGSKLSLTGLRSYNRIRLKRLHIASNNH